MNPEIVKELGFLMRLHHLSFAGIQVGMDDPRMGALQQKLR